ncbi:MAG: hypothetical protein D6766_07460, partial [Verrucomicrobia bacterium]
MLLNNDDLARLLETALAGRAEVRAVECGADRLRVRLGLGPFSAPVELAEFALDGPAIRFRLLGALATRVLGLFREQAGRAGLEVDGDRLCWRLPGNVTRVGELTALAVTPQGLRLKIRLHPL